jgi:hypothetical protein
MHSESVPADNCLRQFLRPAVTESRAGCFALRWGIVAEITAETFECYSDRVKLGFLLDIDSRFLDKAYRRNDKRQHNCDYRYRRKHLDEGKPAPPPATPHSRRHLSISFFIHDRLSAARRTPQ